MLMRFLLAVYLLRRGLFLPQELTEFMESEIAREGLRRLKPLPRLAASLTPDSSSDCARACVLESEHYMRNQLLRDSDWAGLTHSIEIRVPPVDFTLLAALVPAMPSLIPGAGKAARERSHHAAAKLNWGIVSSRVSKISYSLAIASPSAN